MMTANELKQILQQSDYDDVEIDSIMIEFENGNKDEVINKIFKFSPLPKIKDNLFDTQLKLDNAEEKLRDLDADEY